MYSGFPSAPIILFPFLSVLTTPLVLIFPEISDAMFLSFVFKLILYASKISLHPVAVAPLFGTNTGLPKSGLKEGFLNFSSSASYSPFLISGSLTLSGFVADFAYKKYWYS